MVKNAFQFLHEVKEELSKVIWPRFDEFIGSTIIVLIVVAFFSVYLGLLDLLFARFAQWIFALYGSY